MGYLCLVDQNILFVCYIIQISSSSSSIFIIIIVLTSVFQCLHGLDGPLFFSMGHPFILMNLCKFVENQLIFTGSSIQMKIYKCTVLHANRFVTELDIMLNTGKSKIVASNAMLTGWWYESIKQVWPAFLQKFTLITHCLWKQNVTKGYYLNALRHNSWFIQVCKRFGVLLNHLKEILLLLLLVAKDCIECLVQRPCDDFGYVTALYKLSDYYSSYTPLCCIIHRFELLNFRTSCFAWITGFPGSRIFCHEPLQNV